MTLKELNDTFIRCQFKNDDKVRQRLWRKMSKLLRDGIPIIAGLEEVRSTNKSTSPLSVAIGAWVKKMNNGAKLSDAVKNWVSTEEYLLILASERSGTLDVGFESVVKVAKAKAAIRSAVQSGLAYPSVLILLSFGMMYLFGLKIVPAFTKAASSDAWTGFARITVDSAAYVQSYLVYVLVLAILLVVAFFLSLPRWNSALRVKLDRYAPYSVYRVMQGSSWLIALASLVQAGERIEDAVALLAKDADAWARQRMQSALKGLRAGQNIGLALKKSGYGFPDDEIISDIQLYSTKSGFDEALRIIGNEWITESVERIQGLMGAVFYGALLMAGVVIATIVAGLMSMQLQLSQLLQRVGQ